MEEVEPRRTEEAEPSLTKEAERSRSRTRSSQTPTNRRRWRSGGGMTRSNHRRRRHRSATTRSSRGRWRLESAAGEPTIEGGVRPTARSKEASGWRHDQSLAPALNPEQKRRRRRAQERRPAATEYSADHVRRSRDGKKKCMKSSRERKTNLTLKTDSVYHIMNNTCIHLRVKDPNIYMYKRRNI
jgi:hypothetical protein